MTEKKAALKKLPGKKKPPTLGLKVAPTVDQLSKNKDGNKAAKKKKE